MNYFNLQSNLGHTKNTIDGEFLLNKPIVTKMLYIFLKQKFTDP